MTTVRARLKQNLAQRRPLTGVVCGVPSAGLVEFLGGLSFDFIVIDCEHGGPDFETVVEMARAARAAGFVSLVRPWSTEPALLRRFIDCRVDGLLARDIRSADQLEEIAEAVAAAAPRDEDNFITMALLESAEGVAALDSICRAPGLDGILIGRNDLAVSLGFGRNNSSAPQVQEAMLNALSQISARGRSVGAPSNCGLQEVLAAGANMIIYSLEGLLAEAAAAAHANRAAAATAATR